MSGLLTVALFAALGAALGAGYFAALHFNVRVLTHRGHFAAAIILPLVRAAGACAVLAFAAIHGTGALAASLAGFMIARAGALRIVSARP